MKTDFSIPVTGLTLSQTGSKVGGHEKLPIGGHGIGL